MSSTSPIDSLISLALEQKIFPRKQSLVYHFKDVFDNIQVKNKNVLDIGGGMGILSFYSGVMGAQKTVCLEPESDGSSLGMINQFKQFKKKLGNDLNVEHLPLTLQEYLLKPIENFDVVILHNSVNHLNEEACINLKVDKNAYKEYFKMFSILYNTMNKGGKLVISDCSNKNFYNSIGMKSPFANTIEWHKHQDPNTWVDLLKKVGFSNASINWSSPNRLGRIGRSMLKNPFCAYFTSSHFRIAMEK